MQLDNILEKIIGFSITDIVWLLAILFLIVYAIFAFVIVRQVNLLTRTLGTALSPWLKVIAFSHFIASVLILLFVVLLM